MTHRGSKTVLALALLLALACLIYPLYVIRPFRAQGARELAAALGVIRFRPAVTWICALVAIYAAYRMRRWWGAAAAGLVVIFAALCNVNVYEIMFHPNRNPGFESAKTSKLAPEEKVIAIRTHAAARAYPIRSISYHHVINDVLDGVALAATY